MLRLEIIWDLEGEQDGNVQHIEEHGVDRDEVEQVMQNSLSNTTASKSSGHRITFGYTAEGRYLAVVWEHVADGSAHGVPNNRVRST